MSNLSRSLSILIPIYNEEGVINETLKELIQRGFHERYEIIICDDASTDQSTIQVQEIAQSQDAITLVLNEFNGNKIGAINTGLIHVKTPYVLLLDADSMVFEIQKGNLDNLIQHMQDYNISAIGFRIKAHATNLIESFQSLELLLVTDGLRRLLKVIVCLAGSANLWKVDSLKIVLKQHSGFFEGDDLESTILAILSKFKITYDDRQVFASTKLKKNIKELFRQRMNIWDVGLIRVFANTQGFMKQNGYDGAFFQSVYITEVWALPFRILSTVGILLTSILVIVGSFCYCTLPGGILIPKINDLILTTLQSTSWIYIFLWLFNIWLILRASRMFQNPYNNGLMLIVYFTFYMATPLISLITLDFGKMMAITYLWWYSLCAILILNSTEALTTKLHSLILSLLMPFYFAFLFVFPRSFGFMKYFLNRIQGRYSHRSDKVRGA